MVEATSSAIGVGRRERHKKAMWDRLYTASIDLFTEHGYDETSIEDITERADVARGTFFNYFVKKEDVIVAWGAKRRESLRAELDDIVDGDRDMVACLESCMRKLAKINESEWRTARVMLAAWVRAGHPIFEEPFAANLFAEIIQAGVDRGVVAEGVDPARAGSMLRDLYLGTLYRYVGDASEPSNLEVELDITLHTMLLGLLRVDSPRRANASGACT